MVRGPDAKVEVVFSNSTVNANWYTALQSVPTLYQTLMQHYAAIDRLLAFTTDYKKEFDKEELLNILAHSLDTLKESTLLAQRIVLEGKIEVAKTLVADEHYEATRKIKSEDAPPTTNPFVKHFAFVAFSLVMLGVYSVCMRLDATAKTLELRLYCSEVKSGYSPDYEKIYEKSCRNS